MTTCPICGCPTDTPALAFLHEQLHAANMHALSTSQSQTVAELMEAYAAQAVAQERERVAEVLREFRRHAEAQTLLMEDGTDEDWTAFFKELAQRLGVEV